MSEEMESKYFLACLVAMHAICNKVPVQENADLPNAVAAGATDYANSLMEAVYGDNWKQG
jgi:hypothetical protein